MDFIRRKIEARARPEVACRTVHIQRPGRQLPFRPLTLWAASIIFQSGLLSCGLLYCAGGSAGDAALTANADAFGTKIKAVLKRSAHQAASASTWHGDDDIDAGARPSAAFRAMVAYILAH